MNFYGMNAGILCRVKSMGRENIASTINKVVVFVVVFVIIHGDCAKLAVVSYEHKNVM